MTAGSLTLALHTARSGLLATQQALDATANNIANVNSPGYSRKIVNLEQRVVSGVGAGVQVSEVTRSIDEGLLKSLRLELSQYNRLGVQQDYYGRMQELFGAPGDNTSVSHMIEELSASLESLAASPNSSLEQSEVARRAAELSTTFQQMSQTIQDLRQQADSEIADAVTEVNDLISQIGDLNDKIIRNSVVTNDVSDLKDQRDQMLTRLSELVDIRYFYRGDGDVVVFTEGGRTLVDNQPPEITHSEASSVTATTTHAEGDFNGIYLGEHIAGNDITDEIRGGILKGLIELRDGVLPDLQSQLDELAATMRDATNQIHNRGVPFPGLQSMTGTRTFVDTTNAANNATQQIRIDPASGTDVRLIVFDSEGNEAASVTLSALMTSPRFGGNAAYDGGTGYVAGEYWDVAEMGNVVQRWLSDNALAGGGTVTAANLGMTAATVGIDSTGHFAIDLNSTTYSLVIRDEGAVDTRGADQEDAVVQFDKDGDGDADETVNGFSNFFGLNDFFVDQNSRNTHESDVVSGTFAASATTLRFVDGSPGMPLDPGGAGDVTVAIAQGDSLATIATKINAAASGVTASVIPDGSGYRLRIAHNNGNDFEITETGSLLSTLDLHVSDSRTSTTLAVRADILSAPANISRSIPQWDAEIGLTGAYQMSVAGDTVINQLAAQFSNTAGFDLAGGLPTSNLTFSEYAGSLLSRNASLADSNETQAGYQKDLSSSLKYKADTFSGVNMDEEMSNLILLQQSYAAAARVVTVINDMFETLNMTIR